RCGFVEASSVAAVSAALSRQCDSDQCDSGLELMNYVTNRLLLTVLRSLGTLSGSTGRETLAHFTTFAASTGNGFSAGTLHIGKSLASGTTLTMSNLLAGDSFDAQLDVANSGSLDLIYALTTTWTGSDSLASTVQLTIRVKTPAVA